MGKLAQQVKERTCLICKETKICTSKELRHHARACFHDNRETKETHALRQRLSKNVTIRKIEDDPQPEKATHVVSL